MKFKLKATRLTGKVLPEEKLKVKTDLGLYQKLKNENKLKYSMNNFAITDVKQAISELYRQEQPKSKQIKIVTNQAGLDLFNLTLKKEFNKKNIKNEYRKRFSFKSKIFKQTYKFGQ